MINGNGEGSFMIVTVVCNHLREPELRDIFSGHGHADQPPAVCCHEIDILGCGGFCGADEIAFVFPVRVIGDHDDTSVSEFFQCFLYSIHTKIHSFQGMHG